LLDLGSNSEKFRIHISSNLKELYVENSYTDITLVSDEQVAFRAHKFVLSTESSILKDLIISNPCDHPLIYLRGVKKFELQAILQFLYLGKAICTKNLEGKVEKVALDLKIEKLVSAIKERRDEESRKHARVEKQNAVKIMPDIISAKIRQTEDYLTETYKEDFGDVSSADRLFKCKHCEAVLKTSASLFTHVKIKHEGLRHYCEFCTYKATTKQDVTRHKEAVHDGIRYSCDDCDYLAKHMRQLLMHKSALHESVKYYCDQCEYSTGWRNHLKRHEKQKHM